MIKVPLWFDDYCVTWSPAERILRHISSIPCRPVRVCSFFSLFFSCSGALRAADCSASFLLRPVPLPTPQAAVSVGHYTTPQRTWWEEKALANRFACDVAALIRVYEVLSGA